MDFNGVIIEESLENSSVLNKLQIIKTKVEPVTIKHQTPWIKQWTLYTVIVKEAEADLIAKSLSRSLDSKHNWYADFKNDSTHYIIFRNKVFKINRARKDEYVKVVKYGVSLGIPEYQLDFL